MFLIKYPDLIQHQMHDNNNIIIIIQTINNNMIIHIRNKQILISNKRCNTFKSATLPSTYTLLSEQYHCETAYNKQGKIQGHLDIPLNENGLNQAKALASSLTKHIKNPNAVIVSPVLRGKQTGEEIYKQLAGKEELKFAVMEEFAELHYGDLVDELLKDCEDFIIDLKESKWTTGENEASFPGDKGESFNSIISRMKKGFYKLGKEYENGSNIIIATHSQCIEAFLVYLKAFSYLDKGIRSNNKNCTLSKIQFNVNDETFQVKSVFDDLTVDVKKIVSVNVG